jgi:hypothetical protein
LLVLPEEAVTDLRLLPLEVLNEAPVDLLTLVPLPVLEAGNSRGITVTKRAGIYRFYNRK